MTQGVANALAQAIGAGLGLWLAFVIFSWVDKRHSKRRERALAEWMKYPKPPHHPLLSLNYTQTFRTFPTSED